MDREVGKQPKLESKTTLEYLIACKTYYNKFLGKYTKLDYINDYLFILICLDYEKFRRHWAPEITKKQIIVDVVNLGQKLKETADTFRNDKQRKNREA